MTLTIETAERLIYAMLADRKLPAAAFRVGVYFATQMARGTSGSNLSEAELAHMLHMSERHVRNCLRNLQRAGWLSWERPDRRSTNEYRFDLTKIGGGNE